MATTMFFEKTITDAVDGGEVEIEFGRSSFTRENLMYFHINGVNFQLNHEDGREFYDAIINLGGYLGYDK